MGKRTCSIDGCGEPALARGWCGKHYARWRTTGSPLRQCQGCGADLEGPGQHTYCGPDCRPRCSVDGCDGPVRKNSWCAAHYSQWYRTGEAKPFGYKWAEPNGDCVVCGTSVPSGTGRRKHCSNNCQALDVAWTRRGRPRPGTIECIRCGIGINLWERSASGHLKRADTTMCDRCRRESEKHTMSTAEIAERDGTACAICGEHVDMTVRKADSIFCASVDHIIPRALGGLDVPENYQLAHLWCNQVKHKREGFAV